MLRLCPFLGYVFHSKCSFMSIYEKKLQIFSMQGLFFLLFLTKFLSKCPNCALTVFANANKQATYCNEIHDIILKMCMLCINKNESNVLQL